MNRNKIWIQFFNAGVPLCSLRSSAVFLLYTNDQPKCIPRSFVTIYVDDATVDGYTSKTLDDQDLAVDLFSDQVQVGSG